VCTAFVDETVLDPVQLRNDKQFFGFLAGFVLVLVLAVTACCFVRCLYVASCVPPRKEQGANALIAFRFRDVVASIGLMTDAEVMRKVAKFGDTDKMRLESTIRTVVALFMGLQPGKKKSNQRIMPGVPFKVWSPDETTHHVIQEALVGRPQEVALANAKYRLLMLRLTRDVKGQAFPSQCPDGTGTFDSFQSSISLTRRRASVTTSLASVLGLLDAKSELNLEAFQSLMEQHTDLSNDEAETVFKTIDCDGSGTITIEEFIPSVMAAAPPSLCAMDWDSLNEQVRNLPEMESAWQEIVHRSSRLSSSANDSSMSMEAGVSTVSQFHAFYCVLRNAHKGGKLAI